VTSLAGVRILVVEDLYGLAMEMEQLLTKAGAEVIGPFATTRPALDRIAQEPPDCALLDVHLGETTSLDLARVLRMRGVPFVFVTGYDRSALPAEFADVERIEKPVHPERLLRSLRYCVGAADA